MADRKRYKDFSEERKAKARAYRNEYGKEKLKALCMKLNYQYDLDIISHLETKSNVQGYIKGLIRDDIAKEKGRSL